MNILLFGYLLNKVEAILKGNSEKVIHKGKHLEVPTPNARGQKWENTAVKRQEKLAAMKCAVVYA